MELKLSSNFSGKPVSVVVPIEKVIEVFWPKDEKPPISLTVSTVLGADSANAEFSLGEETKESYPGIWLTTDNIKSHMSTNRMLSALRSTFAARKCKAMVLR